MLAVVTAALGFSAAPLVSQRSQRAAVSMGATVRPSDFPVKNAWVSVCSTAGLKPNTLRAGFGAGQDILVACDTGGRVFAAANVCPHIGTPLDQGTVENGAIVCPLHRSSFDLTTGKLKGPWCPAPPLIGPLTGKLKTPRELKVFKCRQQAGKVQVLLDVNAKARYDAGYWRGILDAQGKVDGGYY